MDPRFDRLEVGLENGIIGRTSEKVSVCTSEILSISSLCITPGTPHLMGTWNGREAQVFRTCPHLMGPSDGDGDMKGFYENDSP